MGRKTSPGNLARQAKAIEQIGFVVCDEARKDLGLPRGSRDLVPLKLPDDLQQTVDPMQATGEHDMLPPHEEVHEVGRGDRLDLAAEAAECHAMNAGQQVAVGPLGLAVGIAVAVAGREAAAQDATFRFKPDEPRFDNRRSQ